MNFEPGNLKTVTWHVIWIKFNTGPNLRRLQVYEFETSSVIVLDIVADSC